MTIEELKQALEAATLLPWSWHNDAHHPGKYDWSIQPGVLMADGTDGTPGGDAIDRANARLIVEAVNNLPALIEVAEAHEALQARCAKLEDAASTLLAHLVAAVSVIKRSEENGNHPSCAYGSDTMYRMAMKDFDRCMEAGRDALRSVVDGGADE